MLKRIGFLGIVFGLIGFGYAVTFFEGNLGGPIEWSRFNLSFHNFKHAFWFMYILWDMLHICTFLICLQFIVLNTQCYVPYVMIMITISVLGLSRMTNQGSIDAGMLGSIMHANAAISKGALPQLIILFPIWSSFIVVKQARTPSNNTL